MKRQLIYTYIYTYIYIYIYPRALEKDNEKKTRRNKIEDNAEIRICCVSS